MISTGCSACPDNSVLVPLRNAAIAIFVCVCLILWYFVSWHALVRPAKQNETIGKEAAPTKWTEMYQRFKTTIAFSQKRIQDIVRNFLGQSGQLQFSGLSAQRITQYLKLYISFFQVLASFLTFHVTWPALLLSAMAWLKGTLFLDVIQLPGLSCLWVGVNFQQRLFTYTLGPLVVVTAFLMPALCALILNYRNSNDPQKAAIWDSVIDALWKNVMFWLFLVYPIVSLTTLQAFDCEPAGLGRLAADFNEPCPSIDSLLDIWSFAFFLVYPIGIPLFCLAAMLSMGVHLVARDKIESSILSAVVAKYINLTTDIESRRIAGLFRLASNDNENLKEDMEERWSQVIDNDGDLSSVKVDYWKKQFVDSDSERARVVRRLGTCISKGISISKNKFKSILFLERQIENMYPVFCDRTTKELRDAADINLVGLDPNSIRHFFHEYDNIGGGKISIDAFSDMVHEVVKKNEMFIGVESDRLTNEQAVSLLLHDWTSKNENFHPIATSFVSQWNSANITDPYSDTEGLNTINSAATDYKRMAKKENEREIKQIKEPVNFYPDNGKEEQAETREEMEQRLLEDCKTDLGRRAVAEQVRELGWRLIRDKIISVPDISWDKTSSSHNADVDQGPKSDLANFVIHPDIEDKRNVSNIEKLLASGTFTMPKEWATVNTRLLLEKKAIARVGFVFQAYKINFWFWEMLEMLRK